MKKISVWMLALLLVPGVVMLAGCKKADETDNAATGEPMAEPTPTPAMETIPEATPVLEATPALGDNTAAATPSPAAQ